MSKANTAEVEEESMVDQETVEQETDEIRDAFDESISNELEEDEIKMAMIGAGATFKNVTRLYNQYLIDAGMAISKTDRNQIVEDTLTGCDLDTEEMFDAATDALVESIQGATERSAASLVRAYAKKNDLEVYKKPVNEGATRAGWRSGFYDFLVVNPSCTVDEAKAFINGDGDHEDTSDNVKKSMSTLLGIHNLVNRIAAK